MKIEQFEELHNMILKTIHVLTFITRRNREMQNPKLTAIIKFKEINNLYCCKIL